VQATDWLIAKTALRSMNAAEIVQQLPQQELSARCPGTGPDHRKFHCVFKDSKAR
jgi:hypothetical protein